jgi:pimeloyl-ACP methyl ester carboxylesterase
MATLHTVRAGDIRLAYAVSGNPGAPPMVLLHALGERGGQDSHIDQNKIAAAAALIPRCELVTIPAGHLVHAARPDEFATAVLTWLHG